MLGLLVAMNYPAVCGNYLVGNTLGGVSLLEEGSFSNIQGGKCVRIVEDV